MSKYSIARAVIAEAKQRAAQEGIQASDTIEALIIMTIQESLTLRGGPQTRASLDYEMSNLTGAADFDFVRSR